jgi:hypothetical protein
MGPVGVVKSNSLSSLTWSYASSIQASVAGSSCLGSRPGKHAASLGTAMNAPDRI